MDGAINTFTCGDNYVQTGAPTAPGKPYIVTYQATDTSNNQAQPMFRCARTCSAVYVNEVWCLNGVTTLSSRHSVPLVKSNYDSKCVVTHLHLQVCLGGVCPN